MVSKSLWKSGWFLIRILMDCGSIFDPTSHPKIKYFLLNFGLGVALGPSWRQEGAQSAPRRLQSMIFQEFEPFWIQFRMEFKRFSKLSVPTCAYFISISQLQFSVFRHGGGLSRVAQISCPIRPIQPFQSFINGSKVFPTGRRHQAGRLTQYE